MKPGALAHASGASTASPAVCRCRSTSVRGRHDARRSAERRARCLGRAHRRARACRAAHRCCRGPGSPRSARSAPSCCSGALLGRRTRSSGRRFASRNLPTAARDASSADCLRTCCLTWVNPSTLEPASSGPSDSEPLSPSPRLDFCVWVGRRSRATSSSIYRGFLRVDIEVGRLPAPERKALRQLARRAAWAFDEGLVHLVQRRNGPSDFTYLAIKRPRPRTRAGRRRTVPIGVPEPSIPSWRRRHDPPRRRAPAI